MWKCSQQPNRVSEDYASSNLFEGIPINWGPTFEHCGIGTALSRTSPNSLRFKAPAHLAIIMLSPQPIRELSLNSDRSLRFLAPAGSIEIIPATTELFASWSAPKTSLLTAIHPNVISELAASEFDRVDYELHSPRPGLVDEKAKLIAEMIGSEVVSPVTNTLYLESLHIILAMHLIRNYSSIEQASSLVHRGGLTTYAWRNVNDYIQANLQSNLSVLELAKIAKLSQSHFLRAFRRTVGLSPHRYLVECRLKLAQHLIITTNLSLSDIALRVGFSSHSHLTSSMRRYHNIMPSELRR